MTKQRCWQIRGCDEELWSRCPHAVASTDGLCPLQCNYSQCSAPQHELAVGLDLLDTTANRSLAVKETCWYCRYFIENATGLPIDSLTASC
jgi:hypothetical protein